MLFAIGARFVCMKCSLRGVLPACVRCRGATIDLSTQSLDGDWPLWNAHLDGKRLFAPAVARRSVWLKRLSIVFTVINVVPAFIAPFVVGKSDDAPLSAVIVGSLVGALVMTPLVFLFYWAFLFATALTFHAMGAVLGSMAQWMPIDRDRFRITAFISNVISRPLLGLIRIEPFELQSKAPLRGTLAAPLMVDVVRDRLALLERADAVLTTPLLVKLDAGGEERIDASAGVLNAVQPGRTSGTPELAPWLKPTREGAARRTEIAIGTRVVVRRATAGLVQLDIL
ncbi:MAG: hypothetical protein JNM17_29550 [Archangium sp.]|nr:hypothetical protein [Archangium sp.]